MSIEAQNWALKQRLRLPGEQWLLMLIANAADPTGVAFAWWKGKDHWWTYLVERSRMSKASVFKHLDTLEKLGLGQRIRQPTDDGSFRAVMHLDMEKIVIISEDDAPQEEPQSNDRTEPQSSARTEASPTVGPIEEDSSISDSKPPNPPSGGVCEDVDQELEKWITQCRVLYPEPITNLPKLRREGRCLNVDQREERLTAMKGYASFIAAKKRDGKPRAVMNADKFVREGFEAFLDAGAKAQEAAEMRVVKAASREGRALAVLYRIAGLSPFSFTQSGAECYSTKGKLEAREVACADAPPQAQWLVIDNAQQIAAWRAFVASAIGRPFAVQGRTLRVPWPWPPRKDGTTYTVGPNDDPSVPELSPEHHLTDDDVRSFTGQLPPVVESG